MILIYIKKSREKEELQQDDHKNYKEDEDFHDLEIWSFFAIDNLLK
jgi:hypothetical protein